ncbi:YceI family protein [Agaribacterium haliotis]|uniref:YceI family protein n=1 Tax=Agaribacterium haliotis TaxID=2013869 RepID=UPI000BB56609|nr:YceI family protein [Agaribacterium haliotis]
MKYSILKHTLFKKGLAAALLCFASSFSYADWQINNSLSALTFISIKKGSVAETHHFNALSGQLKKDGSFNLVIDLNSVDTGIDIRDQRMRESLFEVKQYQTAKATGKLSDINVDKLKVGEQLELELPLTLQLHGKTQSLSAKLAVQKQQDGKLRVISRESLIVNAADFDLSSGIQKLTELAGLSSIALAVPVNVDLVLQKK